MIQINDLSVFYGKIQVLKNVSLTVNDGEIFSLIGANGAGKTTLLRAIMGLVVCRRGSIIAMDKELTRCPPYYRAQLGISLVPEGRSLFPEFTVEENLMAGAFPRSDSANIKSDMARIYETFPILSERRSQIARTLSGGEGQMVAIGRALMNRPKLLLMDEPSTGLMPLMVNEIFRVIAQLKEEGITILLVEQNAKKALSVACRAAVLQLGKITLTGRSDELAEDDEIKRAYLGGPCEVKNPLFPHGAFKN